MRRIILQSVAVTLTVAFASRFAESSWGHLFPHSSDLTRNIFGMSTAGLTAGILFFLWRYQHRERVLLLRERERVVRHVHHHIRNSLQVIINRYPEDQLIAKHVHHILREMTYALPGKGRRMPEGPENLGTSDRD